LRRCFQQPLPALRNTDDVSLLRAVARVDLDAIRSNAEQLRRHTGVPLMAVVKADAYGHGLLPVAKAAIAGGATWLGTALVDEALALRAAGITEVRVMAWLTPPGDRFPEAIEADIDLSAASVDAIEEIANAADSVGRPARLHLEVDTGMTRGGVRHGLEETLSAISQSVERGAIIFAGMWSHLARADEPADPATHRQRERFEDALATAAAHGLHPEVRHLANSAGALVWDEIRYDLTRCGIALYGLSPDKAMLGPASTWGLRQAMTLSARLALVKRVDAGDHVSYGGTYQIPTDTIIGILPIGYGDGVPRHGSNTLYFHSREGRHRLLGRVCMDQVVIDLGPDSQLCAGDEVVAFSDTAGGAPTADEWGEWAGTIGYEIVTRLGTRIAREYVGG
jgi:alanine racemase